MTKILSYEDNQRKKKVCQTTTRPTENTKNRNCKDAQVKDKWIHESK